MYYDDKMVSVLEKMYTRTEAVIPQGKALDHISESERNQIVRAFHQHKELGGNKKLPKKEQGLTIINNALQQCGFYLELVAGDIILGPKGQRMLPFCRTAQNAEDDGITIENSRVVFVWENLANADNPSYEILAYLS
jgi:hypothetical protein